MRRFDRTEVPPGSISCWIPYVPYSAWISYLPSSPIPLSLCRRAALWRGGSRFLLPWKLRWAMYLRQLFATGWSSVSTYLAVKSVSHVLPWSSRFPPITPIHLQRGWSWTACMNDRTVGRASLSRNMWPRFMEFELHPIFFLRALEDYRFSTSEHLFLHQKSCRPAWNMLYALLEYSAVSCFMIASRLGVISYWSLVWPTWEKGTRHTKLHRIGAQLVGCVYGRCSD